MISFASNFRKESLYTLPSMLKLDTQTQKSSWWNYLKSIGYIHPTLLWRSLNLGNHLLHKPTCSQNRKLIKLNVKQSEGKTKMYPCVKQARHTFATSEVSVELSVLRKHILRLFRCMNITAPIGLSLVNKSNPSDYIIQ